MAPTVFGSVAIGILNDARVSFFPYLEVTDILAKEFAIFSSISEIFFEYFSNKPTRPSIITSWDASLTRSDTARERDVDSVSSQFGGGILVTTKNLTRRSIPSSTSSLMLTNIVSGKSDH